MRLGLVDGMPLHRHWRRSSSSFSREFARFCLYSLITTGFMASWLTDARILHGSDWGGLHSTIHHGMSGGWVWKVQTGRFSLFFFFFFCI